MQRKILECKANTNNEKEGIIQHAKRNDTQFNRETRSLLLIGRKALSNICPENMYLKPELKVTS